MPGKLSVVPTKAMATQRDLALAYSPGVAEPCLVIAKDALREMAKPKPAEAKPEAVESQP